MLLMSIDEKIIIISNFQYISNINKSSAYEFTKSIGFDPSCLLQFCRFKFSRVHYKSINSLQRWVQNTLLV